jgi:hypothetical protein
MHHGHWQILIGGDLIRGISRTYGDVDSGVLLAYVGSSGFLEIAVREGSAAARLGVEVGSPVRVGPVTVAAPEAVIEDPGASLWHQEKAQTYH